MSDPLAPLAHALNARSVRYVLIGVAGANFYTPASGARFVTGDHDLFLPLDPSNLVNAWAACEDAECELWLGEEPLDRPRDASLAERVVERRGLTRVTGANGLLVDFTLVMKGFDFDTVWKERREFLLESEPVPTARLLHIVRSKDAAGRDKDRLFLATHRDALEQLLKKPDLD